MLRCKNLQIFHFEASGKGDHPKILLFRRLEFLIFNETPNFYMTKLNLRIPITEV